MKAAFTRNTSTRFGHNQFAPTVADFGGNATLPARKRGPKRTPKIEELYRDLIKAGIVKIVRQRGKAPKVVWL